LDFYEKALNNNNNNNNNNNMKMKSKSRKAPKGHNIPAQGVSPVKKNNTK